MPKVVESAGDLKPGEYYEDCAYHPCLCIRVYDDDEISGISLVNGSYPRSCSIMGCVIRKLSYEEALQWKFYGPSDVELENEHKWWHPKDSVAEKYWPKPEQNT